MSKVLQVEGSLHFDEESSDSEDETENVPSNDAPLVFDSDESDEELEIFHSVNDGSVPNQTTTKVSIQQCEYSLTYS